MFASNREIFFLGLLGFGAAVQAEFVALHVVEITENDLGLSEYALYAVFDDPGDEVLTVNTGSIATTTGFFHNTINGAGQSALPFTSAMNAISDHPDADSFLTVGLSTGDDNETALGPFFDLNAFLFGTMVDGFWFNANPTNDQGVAGLDGLVLLAVFTPLNDVAGMPGVVTGNVTIGYGNPAIPGAQFATASFITPAPGALGLLALAGMIGRSRRRRC